MRAIFNYTELPREYKRQANTMLRSTVETHASIWHRDRNFTRVIYDKALRFAENRQGPMFCLVLDSRVVSILSLFPVMLSGAPSYMRATPHWAFCWCFTHKDYRGMGYTRKFHRQMVNALLATGEEFICIDVDEPNIAACALAKSLAAEYPNTVLINSHSPSTYKYTLSTFSKDKRFVPIAEGEHTGDPKEARQ